MNNCFSLLLPLWPIIATILYNANNYTTLTSIKSKNFFVWQMFVTPIGLGKCTIIVSLNSPWHPSVWKGNKFPLRTIYCAVYSCSYFTFWTTSPRILVQFGGMLVSLKFTERQILWSFCSVDFHTLTLQLPIQIQNSVAPELPSFCEFTSNFSKIV